MYSKMVQMAKLGELRLVCLYTSQFVVYVVNPVPLQ